MFTLSSKNGVCEPLERKNLTWGGDRYGAFPTFRSHQASAEKNFSASFLELGIDIDAPAT